MAEVLQLKGLKKVTGNFSKARKGAAAGVEIGLKKAGLFLQAQSQKLVPVDTGNLRNTAFTRSEGSGVDTEVHVGYTAEYAVYVHEDLFASHMKKDKEGQDVQIGQAKFLEQPMREHRDDLIRIVRDEVKRRMSP